MSEVNGFDICEQIIDELKKAGADKAVARLGTVEQNELNVDSDKITLYRTTDNLSINLVAYSNNRKGAISINRFDKDSIIEAAHNAMNMAKSSIPDEANDISIYQGKHVCDYGNREADNEKLYDRQKEFLDYVHTKYPVIKLEQCVSSFDYSDNFYTNSNGTQFEEKGGVYEFGAMFTSKDGENSSSFNSCGAVFPNLDKAFKDWGNTDTLLQQSTEQTKLSSIDGSFLGDIIVTPDCVDFFYSSLADIYMSDYCLITNSTPWKDKLNHKVISDLVTINSVPKDPRIQVPYAFTQDGFLVENCSMIEKGILKNFNLGFFGSKKTGLPRCKSGCGSIIIESGNVALKDMIKSVKKGILLSRFSGGHPSDNGDFSGVAKNSYLIENGKIVKPVCETMIAGNFEKVWNNVVSISKESIDYGTSIFPYIQFKDVTISGK